MAPRFQCPAGEMWPAGNRMLAFPQDWVDLAAIAATRRDLDVEVVEELLVALRGPGVYPRLARFRSLLRREPAG